MVPLFKDTTLRLGGQNYLGTIWLGAYAANRLCALSFRAPNGEPIAKLTVNPFPADSGPFNNPSNLVFVKDYAENEGVLAQLLEKDLPSGSPLLRPTGKFIQADFAELAMLELSREAFEIFTTYLKEHHHA